MIDGTEANYIQACIVSVRLNNLILSHQRLYNWIHSNILNVVLCFFLHNYLFSFNNSFTFTHTLQIILFAVDTQILSDNFLYQKKICAAWDILIISYCLLFHLFVYSTQEVQNSLRDAIRNRYERTYKLSLVFIIISTVTAS